MKLLLINPDYMQYSSPPLGLISLAAYVRQECSFLELRLLDQVPENKFLKNIYDFSPDIVGFTAVSENYHLVKYIAKKIKEIFPKVILVLGGIHISSNPDSFKDSIFDVAIRGEGEIAFKKFLENFKKNRSINFTELKKIKGLMFRYNKKVIDTGLSEFIQNLDDLPLPARDLLDKHYYKLPSFSGKGDIEPTGMIMTSRGCPFNCRFCSSYAIWKQRIRFFSAERVVKEIEIMYQDYGYKKISFADDVFTVNKPRLKKIISLLKEKGLLGKIKFVTMGRADSFDDETAKLLKELNVLLVTFGIETGSQKMLTYLKRGNITIQQGIDAINLAKKYNMMGGGFFMLGSPGETLQDMEETYQFIKNYCRESFAIHQIVPFPGTEIWDYAIKNKIIDKKFYETPQKDFVDVDPNLLLSDKVSKEDFLKMFYKIKSLHIDTSRKNLFHKFKTLKMKHISLLLNPFLIKKAIKIRHRFFKFVLKDK